MSFYVHNSEQKQVSNIEQFESLFNFATIGMIITNVDGQIINFNRIAEIQFGYTKHEVLGKTIELLIPASAYNDHAKYREEYFCAPDKRVMAHGKDIFGEKKNGDIFPVEVSLSYYTINKQAFVIAFVIDISERKRQEEAMLQQKFELERVATKIKEVNNELEQKVNERTKLLRKALIELERSKEELNEAFENEKELGELKSRFVTMASHEFRTPLSTILSSTFLLEKYNLEQVDPRVEKHLHRIKAAVGGMKGILEDFLSLGKLEEGLVQTNIEIVTETEIVNLVNGLIKEFEFLTKPGQQLCYYNTIDTPVLIDRNLLKNILNNLISNAIKFSNAHAVISIASAVADDHLTISVADDGIGISEHDQEHLFKRFFRAKNAINIEGTGLGLHIVNNYLQLMNGRIEMTSKLNVGSTFTIYIPQNIRL